MMSKYVAPAAYEMSPYDLVSNEAHLVALQIEKLLNGLPINEAQYLLDCIANSIVKKTKVLIV